MSMSIGENIKRFREKRGMNQQELASAVGISQQALAKVENNITRHSRHLPQIAAKLGISLTSIDPSLEDAVKTQFIPENEVFSSSSLPIYASAEGGDGAVVISFDPIDYEKRPTALSSVKGAYGIYVVGESMSPVYNHGDRAFVNPHLPPYPGEDVLLINPVSETEVHAKLKKIVKVHSEFWEVEQYNPPKTFKLSKEKWSQCHVIIGKINRR